jgi:hypothetical protein
MDVGGLSNSGHNLETPPSSGQDSPDLLPGNVKKRQNRVAKDGRSRDGIERAISTSLGTDLDKSKIVAVPPTPPGSYSTPKISPLPSDWVGDILGRGKTIVGNVKRRSSTLSGDARDDICFEHGVEVLSLADAIPIGRGSGAIETVHRATFRENESDESDVSDHEKVQGDSAF